MSVYLNAENLMRFGGIAVFILTIYWVRSRGLREKYGVAWVCVATLLLLCGVFPDALKHVAEMAKLSYPSAVLFLSLATVYVFSFSVSLSLSKHHRSNVRLTQEIAILEHRLIQLEEQFDRGNQNPNSSS